MQNKTYSESRKFQAMKAKPVNTRSKHSNGYVPNQELIRGEVYRLCEFDKTDSSILKLENQLGIGTYFFIPDSLDCLTGAVIVRKPDGNYIWAYTDSFYVAYNEGCFKLASPRDKKDKNLILTMLKGIDEPNKSMPLNWE